MRFAALVAVLLLGCKATNPAYQGRAVGPEAGAEPVVDARRAALAPDAPGPVPETAIAAPDASAPAPDANTSSPDLAPSAPAGAVFKVGSFTKPTGAAPDMQTVTHGLGVVPKALILWTVGKAAVSSSGDYHFGMAISDGPTSSRAMAIASQDNVSPSAAGRRMAAKALTINGWGDGVMAEADLTAWDANSFTLRWSPNDATAVGVHFIVIGGPSVKAKLVQWAAPIMPGSKAITGVGFKPAVVLNLYLGAFTDAVLPYNTTDADVGIGVTDASGARWAMELLTLNGDNPTIARRTQVADACMITLAMSGNPTKRASITSMDADGFTVNFPVSIDQASTVFSLALSGVAAKAGSVRKSVAAAPAMQAITGVGFRPGLVLLSSIQDVPQTASVIGARWGLGASDGSSQQATALTDANGLPRSRAAGLGRTTKAFVKMNNDQRVVEAEAEVTGFTADGATLNWTTNDPVATELDYLMLGAAP